MQDDIRRSVQITLGMTTNEMTVLSKGYVTLNDTSALDNGSTVGFHGVFGELSSREEKHMSVYHLQYRISTNFSAARTCNAAPR